jgi:serine/threonine-protein kinase
VLFLAVTGAGIAISAISEPEVPQATPRVATPAPVQAQKNDAPRVAAVASNPPRVAATAEETPPKKLPPRFEKKLERLQKAEKAALAANMGLLELAIAPWGEVLVDGRPRGVSPPLRVLEIPPGPHTIEIRNSTFPSRVERVDVKPGEPVKIRHRFGK